MSNDLHQATGSMPAQPEEEKIESPVETPAEGEQEINEMSDDVPSDDENAAEGENGPVGEGSDGEEPAKEEEADPNGEEPVTEPINE